MKLLIEKILLSILIKEIQISKNNYSEFRNIKIGLWIIRHNPLSSYFYLKGFIYKIFGYQHRATEFISRGTEFNAHMMHYIFYEAKIYYPQNTDLHLLAQSHMCRRNYKEAILVWDKLISANKYNIDALSWIGECYSRLKKYENAIEVYKSVASNSDDPLQLYHTYCQLGQIFCRIKRYRKSIEWFDKALKIAKDNHYVYFNRAITLLNLGEFEKAINDTDKALELGAQENKTYHLRGCIFLKLGQNEKAIIDFKKAIELSNIIIERELKNMIIKKTKAYNRVDGR